MKKRIFAWILLGGFVLLILNLLVIRLYWKESMVVYLIIVFAFVLTNGNLANLVGGKNHYNFDDMNPDIPDEADKVNEADETDGEEIEGNSEVEAVVADIAEGTDGIDEVDRANGADAEKASGSNNNDVTRPDRKK